MSISGKTVQRCNSHFPSLGTISAAWHHYRSFKIRETPHHHSSPGYLYPGPSHSNQDCHCNVCFSFWLVTNSVSLFKVEMCLYQRRNKHNTLCCVHEVDIFVVLLESVRWARQTQRQPRPHNLQELLQAPQRKWAAILQVGWCRAVIQVNGGYTRY